MCDPATLTAAAAIASAGAGAYTALTQKTPKAPEVQAPEKPPQAAKAPDAGSLRRNNANASLLGPMSGNSSTLLTGPSGIDPGMLNLGRNTLLGS